MHLNWQMSHDLLYDTCAVSSLTTPVGPFLLPSFIAEWSCRFNFQFANCANVTLVNVITPIDSHRSVTLSKDAVAKSCDFYPGNIYLVLI